MTDPAEVEQAWQRAAGRAVAVTLLAVVQERDSLRGTVDELRRDSRPARRDGRLARAVSRLARGWVRLTHRPERRAER